MAATYANLYVEQNADFSVNVTIDDIYENFYDLSNFTSISQIRKSYYSKNPTAVFNTNINSSAGTLLLQLDASITANIAPGRYVYDAVITNSITNEKIRVLEGIIDVSPCTSR